MSVALTALGSNVPNKVPQVFSASTGVLSPGGNAYITYAGVCALTLAAPTEDGLDLYVYALTAHAHTVTTPSNNIAGSDDTATFGGSVGNYIHLQSFGGQWFMYDESGITLSEV